MSLAQYYPFFCNCLNFSFPWFIAPHLYLHLNICLTFIYVFSLLDLKIKLESKVKKLNLLFILFKFRTDSVGASHDSMLVAMTTELEQLLASVS